MFLFIAIAIVFWTSALAAWWTWEHRRRSADLDRMKQRLDAKADGPKKGRREPALLRGEQAGRGRMALEVLRRLRLHERTKTLFEQAGLKWDVARTVHGSVALFLAGLTLAWHVAPSYRVFAPLAGVLTGSLPALYVLRRRRKRLHSFEEQFPESLEFLARSMRAGHAFSVSLEMIHNEFQEPLAGEFRRAFDEQNLGLPLDVALEKMAERVPLIDVRFFVSAVLLQKRTGGNLAELLDKLAYLIRERFKLRGRIRAISAHGRMTGSVLTAIPVVVGGIMCYVNPSYANFFTGDETGQWMLGGAIGMQIIGYAVIKKIVSIEV